MMRMLLLYYLCIALVFLLAFVIGVADARRLGEQQQAGQRWTPQDKPDLASSLTEDKSFWETMLLRGIASTAPVPTATPTEIDDPTPAPPPTTTTEMTEATTTADETTTTGEQETTGSATDEPTTTDGGEGSDTTTDTTDEPSESTTDEGEETTTTDDTSEPTTTTTEDEDSSTSTVLSTTDETSESTTTEDEETTSPVTEETTGSTPDGEDTDTTTVLPTDETTESTTTDDNEDSSTTTTVPATDETSESTTTEDEDSNTTTTTAEGTGSTTDNTDTDTTTDPDETTDSPTTTSNGAGVETCMIEASVQCVYDGDLPCSDLTLLSPDDATCSLVNGPTSLGWIYRGTNCDDSTTDNFGCLDASGGPSGNPFVNVLVLNSLGQELFREFGLSLDESFVIPTADASGELDDQISVAIFIGVDENETGGVLQTMAGIPTGCNDGDDLTLGNIYGALELVSYGDDEDSVQAVQPVEWQYSVVNVGAIDAILTEVESVTDGETLAQMPDEELEPDESFTFTVPGTINLQEGGSYTGELSALASPLDTEDVECGDAASTTVTIL